MGRVEQFRDRYYQNKEVIEEQVFLSQILEGKDLTPKEDRAVHAADIIDTAPENRKVIFGAHIFINSGVYRAQELLGLNHDQSRGMRDRVKTNKKYHILWLQYEMLQAPNYLEVANLRKNGIKQSQIASKLGLTTQQVKKISEELIASGIIEMSNLGKGNSRKFEIVVNGVSEIDRSQDDSRSRITEKEIADRLGVSVYVVRLARKRIRLRSYEEPKPLTQPKGDSFEEVMSRREMVLSGIKAGLTNEQISSKYRIPLHTIRNDRTWLRKKRKIEKRKYSKDENLRKMRLLIREQEEESIVKVKMNLRRLHKLGKIPVSYAEFCRIYNEATGNN